MFELLGLGAGYGAAHSSPCRILRSLGRGSEAEAERVTDGWGRGLSGFLAGSTLEKII